MKEKHSEDTIVERIQQIVGKMLAVAPDTLKLTDPVFGLGDGLLNSLYWVEVTDAIEKEFHLVIPEEDTYRLETIGDYVGYIYRLQNGLPSFEDKPSPTQPSAEKQTAQKNSTPELSEQQKQESLSRSWEFHQGHWEATTDTIQQRGMEPDQDIKYTLQKHGYKPLPILRMGKREQGMQVDIYVKEHKKGNGTQNYYIRLHIGPEVETIYVSNLPSLLSLLQRLGTIIANSHNIDDQTIVGSFAN